MPMYEGLHVVLPGRLNEIELDQVGLEKWDTFTLLVFHLSIDSNCFIVQYELETDLWEVHLDNARFKKIPLAYRPHVSEMDAIRVLQKVLVEADPKGSETIKALKRWRALLHIRPVKVVSLKK